MLQVLINAGQANAATGDQGYQDCITSAEALASALNVDSSDILLESTGVIGRRIKINELVTALQKLAEELEDSHEAAMHAAVAITTTDLVSKSAAIEVRVPLFGTQAGTSSAEKQAPPDDLVYVSAVHAKDLVPPTVCMHSNMIAQFSTFSRMPRPSVLA